nr:hypothetical protein [Tanacetum cinerariifolium]
HTPDKLQQRSVKRIFVGYPKETMGYYFYYLPENKIVVERYADFLEKNFILQKESGRTEGYCNLTHNEAETGTFTSIFTCPALKQLAIKQGEPSEEDNDPEQAQRDKDMQKNLALIAKYFKRIYKPTNNNLRTFSNSRNKNVDRTPRENVGIPVVQQSGIKCFNCKEFSHFAKKCRKSKRVKDSAYHKEKMLLYKQAEKAHYSYMAKIQEVATADSCTDSKPLEHVQNDTRYNMFANDLQHSEQSESISNTCIVETGDSNVILDSPDMCDDDIQNDQNDIESNDERVSLANLIANLKLDNKQTEFEKYKAFNDRTVDYDKLKHGTQQCPNQNNSSAFRAMIEKHQLTGPNFNEWVRALKLVVRIEKLHDVFEIALPPAPVAGADAKALADWAILFYRHNEVACLMLGTMSPKLYQHFEHNSPLEMVTELQKMYGKPLGVELQELSIVDASSTPQVMAIQGGRVQKYKLQGKAKGKGKGKGKVKDILGLIHIDVCGPLRHVSKKGASYFITSTDDYIRYGYVYLLKHKHEVFETFKVFKSEIENQLGKTIKAIRSNRGGEYISQEFKDYLKACGIVQQLTPPYTPQHNGDYALDSAARILNMVPTKKVDKTPYELWHGKVPNLSYLKVWGFVERYADFLEKDFILQRESGRIVELEDEDILPSENTSEHPIEKESLSSIISQEEDVIPVCRFVRTHKAPDRLCLNVEIDPDRLCFNVEVEEHNLWDLNEPVNYKAA